MVSDSTGVSDMVGRAMIKNRIWAVLLCLALVLAALVAMRPLLPIDETRYLAVAWEMWLSHDPVHLTKNFALYTHKPPLLFWLINLVWLITGVSEWAGRAVGPISAIAVVGCSYLLAKRFWPEKPDLPLIVALMLSGFSVFLSYGSATMFDCLLALAVLGGVTMLWSIATGNNTRANWLWFGLALAIGVYAKGPVILVHLMPLVLTMPIWAPIRPELRASLKGFGLSFGFALLLVAFWLVPAIATGTPEYRTELLWTQSAARVAGGLAHDRPVWFLAALLPAILFPWAWSWRVWSGIGKGWRSDPALRLCVIWAISTLVLFSLISGKQVHYLIPAFPAVAMLFARSAGESDSSAKSLAWVPLGILAVAFAAIGLGFVPMTGDLVALVPRWPALVFGLICVGLAVQSLRLKLIPGHLMAGVGVALGLHGVIATTGLYAEFAGRELNALVAAHAGQGVAVINHEYNAEFNFAPRLTTPVALPTSEDELKVWASAHPEGIVIGRAGEMPLVEPPQGAISYMGQSWSYWSAASFTSLE